MLVDLPLTKGEQSSSMNTLKWLLFLIVVHLRSQKSSGATIAVVVYLANITIAAFAGMEILTSAPVV